MRRWRGRSERGSVILIALMLIGMLTLVAVLAIENSNTDVELSYNQLHSDQAFYVAEAGAKQAYSMISADRTWNTGYTDESFGEGTFTVVVRDSFSDPALTDTVVVTSTGHVRLAQTTVEYTLVPDELHPFQYAMFAENQIDIKNSMETDSYNSDSGSYADTRMDLYGDLGSNGTIIVHNGADIGGDVQTSLAGGLSIMDISSVAGDTSSTAPEAHLDPIPESDYFWAETNNDNLGGISGTYSYDPATHALISDGTMTLTDGVYYFSDITLRNSAQLLVAPGADVTIYVTGDIEMKNSASVNTTGDPGDLIIYSQGDIVLKNSGDIKAVFYNPEGSADLRNSGEFYGSIVARDIIAHNSSLFHYDRQLGSITWPNAGEMSIAAWREY